jgi:NAD(P)-dependent dehydrogenase (short-subunit alcohol dehydrogenase family)
MEKLLPVMDVTPMGPRMGTPQEIAHGVMFFCEEESRWITGVCMLVNGGITMA